MASIQERKTKSGKYYYLAERKGATPIYLGTKAPWPQSQGWQNLAQEQIDRAKRKAIRRKTRPTPNPLLPEGKYAVICADPPWNVSTQSDLAECKNGKSAENAPDPLRVLGKTAILPKFLSPTLGARKRLW